MKHESILPRRVFLKNSGKLVAGATLAGSLAAPGYAAEENTIRVALVGCGGRGTGAAANAFSTARRDGQGAADVARLPPVLRDKDVICPALIASFEMP